ncbi:S1 family peptidase [Thiocystis violascens]|uniref:Trypsin-like serine protease with C-terminal PDZ domain n=1 Tax=Thiocystis violascens (strain ATCC 17096 / DSM 198 / 6111) TaxID=765911 RepID=I3YGH1_THIV6|nr:serine protease [Thiocystis violascens]AFL76089.1 hypothetical protein Thivi_4276 [Thiocystis violascens DSM 198]
MSRLDSPFRNLLGSLIPVFLLVIVDVQVQPASASALVNCHDEARGMVSRIRADNCQGRQVTDAEAAAIRDRRRSYVKESFDANLNPTVPGKRLASIGAGFFVDTEGALLTNAHVVKDCGALVVSRPGGEMRPARLIAAEPGIDLALIKTDFRPQRGAVFAPPDALLPTRVSIIGYPNQGLAPLRPLLTAGGISAPNLQTAASRPISIHANVRPGNSGGPALDGAGRVVGVVFAAVDTPAVYKNTGRVVRDVGVAIPNRLSLSFLERSGVSPTTTGVTAKRDNLLKEANQFVARVECWR